MRLGDFSRAIAEVEDAVEVYRSMDSPQAAWRYTVETQVWMCRYEKHKPGTVSLENEAAVLVVIFACGLVQSGLQQWPYS